MRLPRAGAFTLALGLTGGKAGLHVLAAPTEVASHALSSQTVSIGSDDSQLDAVDALTGHQRWHFLTGDHVDSSPAVG